MQSETSQTNGHGKCAAHDNETLDARFPLSCSPPEGERDKVSLREFHGNYAALAANIKEWGRALGFQAVGISDTALDDAEARLLEWLARGYHGEMDYMAKHGTKRSRPAELIPGTLRVISLRMDYYPPDAKDAGEVLQDSSRAFISRYALGRDYHKVLRNRLEKLAEKIRAAVGEFGYRVFSDSAPVMEIELAQKAHLGWCGKHTLLL